MAGAMRQEGLWLCREALRQLNYIDEYRTGGYYAIPMREEVELRPIWCDSDPHLRARIFTFGPNGEPYFEFFIACR